jgi:hypothetical protein
MFIPIHILFICARYNDVFFCPTITRGDITGDFNSNESDNKLVDNGNHEERGSVSENKVFLH